MISRRQLFGWLAAVPFVPKIVEAAVTVKETAELAHDAVSVEHRIFDECGSACDIVCDQHAHQQTWGAQWYEENEPMPSDLRFGMLELRR